MNNPTIRSNTGVVRAFVRLCVCALAFCLFSFVCCVVFCVCFAFVWVPSVLWALRVASCELRELRAVESGCCGWSSQEDGTLVKLRRSVAETPALDRSVRPFPTSQIMPFSSPLGPASLSKQK